MQRNLLLDVPDGFFTTTFFMSGILLQISKNYARVRLEENAWEQRLTEARQKRLDEDPSLTELDLRRQEAAQEWSAYGKPRVLTLEREQTEVMTDEDILAFEREYGIDYDPYYDEPYEEDDLPEGPYEVDRLYGDRIYENGEVFFKNGDVFYRQGAKPRSYNFFSSK